LFSLAARTIVVTEPAAGTTTGSRAVTGTVTGTFSGASPVFGTVSRAFALALAGTAAVALPGTLAPALSPASSLTTAPAAAGQKDIHAVILEISDHLVCGLDLVAKPTTGIIRTGIRV